MGLFDSIKKGMNFITGADDVKKAGEEQAKYFIEAQRVSEKYYSRAKQEYLNRTNPALEAFDKRIAEIKRTNVLGKQEALTQIRDTFDRSSATLRQTGQLTNAAIMGERPGVQTGTPYGQAQPATTPATTPQGMPQTQPVGPTAGFMPETTGMGDIAMTQDPVTGQYVPAPQVPGMQGAATVRPELTSGFYGAGAQIEAGRDIGSQALQGGFGTARGDITQGEQGSLAAIASGRQHAMKGYDPYMKYGEQAAYQEAALSGALGPEEQQKALDAFIESPGQQYLREQQEKALLRSSSATGGLGGANVLKALQEQAMGIAATQQQQHLSNLGTIAGRSANLVGERGQLLQGFAGKEADVMQQAAQAKANFAAQLGISEAELETMSSSQLAQLAQQTGMAQADVQQMLGLQQIGLLQQRGSDKLGVKTGTTANISALGELAAQAQLQGRTAQAQTTAGMTSDLGTRLSDLTTGTGSAISSGLAGASQQRMGTLTDLAGIATYGLSNMTPVTKPSVTKPQANIGYTPSF